jgi:glycosyltransferase involved in cell wall biosynthesis
LNPFISLIIPVYNVEQYLSDCFNSILTQPGDDIEIIVINDGSTDKSPEICQSYARKDTRIKITNKKNEGLGYARNYGLEVASGEYVAFLDSDDWISQDMVLSVKKILQGTDIQLLEFGLIQIDVDKSKTGLKLPRIKPGTYSRENITEDILPNFLSDRGERISNSVCNHIYRRDIIENNKIRFFSEREIFTEDFLFTLQYILNADNLTVIDEVLYYYRLNQDSLTKVYRPHYLQLVINRDIVLREILTIRGIIDKYEKYVTEKFLANSPSFIFNAFRRVGSSSFSEVTGEFRSILNNPKVIYAFKKLDFKKIPFKKWLLYFLMRHRRSSMIYLLLRFFQLIKK